VGIRVTDVSFSIAKRVESGSCGFCRVILNDCIAINRIRVNRSGGEYSVLLPRSEKQSSSTGGKPIVQLLDEETVEIVTNAVMEQYHKLIEDSNGLYQQKPRFRSKEHIN